MNMNWNIWNIVVAHFICVNCTFGFFGVYNLFNQIKFLNEFSAPIFVIGIVVIDVGFPSILKRVIACHNGQFREDNLKILFFVFGILFQLLTLVVMLLSSLTDFGERLVWTIPIAVVLDEVGSTLLTEFLRPSTVQERTNLDKSREWRQMLGCIFLVMGFWSLVALKFWIHAVIRIILILILVISKFFGNQPAALLHDQIELESTQFLPNADSNNDQELNFDSSMPLMNQNYST